MRLSQRLFEKAARSQRPGQHMPGATNRDARSQSPRPDQAGELIRLEQEPAAIAGVFGVQAPVGLESCWVADGRLLAGAHPAAGPYALDDRLSALLDAGVRHFIDLTRDGELPAYERLLGQLAHARSTPVSYSRLPIPHRAVPETPRDMESALGQLEDCLADGGVTYMHGHDPMRRVGMVVGCFLVRRGQASGVALDWLETRHWRNGGRLETRPLTQAQKDFVTFWGKRKAA